MVLWQVVQTIGKGKKNFQEKMEFVFLGNRWTATFHKAFKTNEGRFQLHQCALERTTLINQHSGWNATAARAWEVAAPTSTTRRSCGATESARGLEQPRTQVCETQVLTIVLESLFTLATSSAGGRARARGSLGGARVDSGTSDKREWPQCILYLFFKWHLLCACVRACRPSEHTATMPASLPTLAWNRKWQLKHAFLCLFFCNLSVVFKSRIYLTHSTYRCDAYQTFTIWILVAAASPQASDIPGRFRAKFCGRDIWLQPGGRCNSV